jgi:hypothetical protein
MPGVPFAGLSKSVNFNRLNSRSLIILTDPEPSFRWMKALKSFYIIVKKIELDAVIIHIFT